MPDESLPDVATDYIFEPDPQTILNEVLRGLTELQILQAIYESIASEQSARMVAMRNATDAANDLIGELTLSYNKARQEVDHQGIAGHRRRRLGAHAACERPAHGLESGDLEG